MGYRVGVAGHQNTGKSYGRRYIPDGENVMIIQPSVKASHLFTGPKNAHAMSTAEIDKAIKEGTRKPVKPFNIKSPEGKYNSTEEALALITKPELKSLAFVLANIDAKKPIDYFGKNPRQYLTGNVILCEELENLQLFISFVNKWMPWIHTIILPDFTHFVSEAITSPVFIARKANGEQYSKYLDLAASSLRGFIKSSDALRNDLIVVSEYHAEWLQEKEVYKLFLPGGKMFEEKFLPTSYYDDIFFTDVKFSEDNDEDAGEYRFVTRKTKKYPEARNTSGFDELYIPNNLQTVLEGVRKYNGIELTGKIVE